MSQARPKSISVRRTRPGAEGPEGVFVAMGNSYLQQLLSLLDLNQLAVNPSEDPWLLNKLLDEAMPILNKAERKELSEFFGNLGDAVAAAIGRRIDPETGETVPIGDPDPEFQRDIELKSDEVKAVVEAIFGRALSRIGAPDRSEIISQALVSAAVSSFEVLLGALAGQALKKNKAALVKSEYEFTLEELLTYESIEEARNELISRRIDKLLRESVDDWSNWCKKTFQSDLQSLTPEWPAVREVFARRNLITHNASRINTYYMNVITDVGLRDRLPADIGSTVTLVTDQEYAREALERLMALGLCLIHSAWSRLYPKTAVSAANWLVGRQSIIVHYSFWHAVKAVSHCLASSPKDRRTECLGIVNGWLAKRHLDEVDSIRDEISSWDTSGLEPIFALYKACLTDDLESAVRLVDESLGSSSLTKYDYMVHPIFDKVREAIRMRSQNSPKELEAGD